MDRPGECASFRRRSDAKTRLARKAPGTRNDERAGSRGDGKVAAAKVNDRTERHASGHEWKPPTSRTIREPHEPDDRSALLN
jgi:hypothetical protein